MSNPLFNILGGATQSFSKQNPFRIVQDFIDFKKQHKNINPQEEINRLLQSGKINQEQLNELQGTANQLKGLLGQFMKIK